MFESDSVQIDNTSTDFSEVDSKRNTKNLRINELYDELMKENQLLRSQFEEAVNLTSQMEELSKQNSSLLTQIRDLKAEKDDLNHRLDILVQKDKENHNKLQNEKACSTSQRGSDLTSMNKEIEKIKLQSKSQMDSIYAQLEHSEQAREKESVEKRLLISKLDRIIAEASRFFETNLQTVDDVFESLNGPKICISNETTASGLPVQIQIKNALAQKEAECQKKIHRLKNKVVEGEKAKEALEEEIKKIQRDSQMAQQQSRSEISDLSANVERLKEDMGINEKKYEANIQKYQAQNEQLKSDLSKLKEKVHQMSEERKNLKRQMRMNQIQQPQQLSPSSSDPNLQQSSFESRQVHLAQLHQKHDQAIEAATEKLQQTIADLKEELTQSNKKKDLVSSQLKDKDTQIHNLGIQIEKTKNEYAALDTVHQETLLEVESLRQALLTREKAKDEIKNAPKVKKPNPYIVKLQKSLDEHKQKFYALQIVSGKQDTKIQDQEADIRHLQVKCRDAESDLSRARAEALELRTKLENRVCPTPDDLLPPCAFRCEDFSPELSTQVAKIANNPSLQPASKVQNTYKAIRKFFTKQLALRDAALDGAYNENQTISNAINQFLVDASIALCDQPVTFNDFFAQNAGKIIVEKIASIRADNATLIHQNDLMKSALIHMKETFIEIGDASDPISHVAAIKEKIEQLNNDVTIRNKKLRQYKSTLTATQAQAKSRENELLTENQTLKFQIDDLAQQIKKCTDEISSLRRNNQQLNIELSDVNHTREDLESTIINDHDEQLQQAQEDLNKQITKLKDQLRVQKEQFDHLELEYNDVCEQLNRTKKQLQLVKSQKLQKDAEYDELVKVSAEKEEAAASRLESEKQHLTESYENALQKLHVQCEQHRSDVEKINASLSEEQIKLANLKATLARVEKEKLKAIADMQSTKNQMKREKLLMESTIRTQKLQVEAQYNERLEAYKGKAEAEKRALLAFGADSFHDFFNPGTTIDERSYKYVIEKAHEKLVQLSRSDAHVRRMVSAFDNQTTEDAVAQLLLNSA